MQETLLKLKEKWSELSNREKRMVTLGAAVVGLFILYVGIWSPYLAFNEKQRVDIQAQRKVLVWMKTADQTLSQKEKEVKRDRVSLSPVELLAVIQKQMHEAGWNMQQKALKQTSSDTISLRLEQVNFDQVMTWLLSLTAQYRVFVPQMTVVSAQSPGVVNMEMTLQLNQH